MKVLVTGGAGFIGSNVVDAYIANGHEVVVVDNLFTGKMENLNPKAKFYLMDIRSQEFHKVLQFERPEIINHHAAQISVPGSVENPIFDASVNIQGFINILEGARSFGTKKIIFISSGGAIYGEAQEYPTSERYPPQPLSPYAISKAVSENYLAFYHHHYGLAYTVLRYANIYGPRQIPHGEAGVVAIFMDRLLEGKSCTIFHYPDEPEGMIRDYCYVGDVVKANIIALDAGSGMAFNIGTGMGTKTQPLFESIFDLAKDFVAIDASLRKPMKAEARPGDLTRSCLDIHLAREKIGWQPEIGLRSGLEKTWKWKLNIL